MSVQALTEMLDNVGKDAAFAAAFADAVGGKKGDDAFVAVAKFANDSGYAVTVEDAAAVQAQFDERLRNGGELADRDLEAVAGGHYGHSAFFPSR